VEKRLPTIELYDNTRLGGRDSAQNTEENSEAEAEAEARKDKNWADKRINTARNRKAQLTARRE
jgi:hypothetical protein